MAKEYDEMKCPQCGIDLGKSLSEDANIGFWHCLDCNIKIYKE